MLFNSVEFLLFFTAVTIIYFTVPNRWRWLVLLISSYFFYGSWSWKYLLLMISITMVTYVSGILIENTNNNQLLAADQKKKRNKLWVALSLVLNLGLLFYFKYYNFALGTIGFLFSFTPTYADILLPIGISFHTFQALSYTIDVYRGEMKTERHIGKYALYGSFFPQIIAGPIEKSTHLLPQMHTEKVFSYENTRSGLILIAWGFLKKIVIADRLGVYVNSVYGDLQNAHGIELFYAVLFFAFQLYCDFSAYSDIARGTARILGYDLILNFNRPYLASSFSDFWKRWHISLNAWFREYLYIPLGGNKKGNRRTLINIMIVFLVSGLWHGASWNFVLWGALNGLLLISLDRFFVKKPGSFFGSISRGVLITSLWAITLIFFRAKTLEDAILVFKKIGFSDSAKLYMHGLNVHEFKFAIYCIILLYIFEIIQERVKVYDLFIKRPPILRWTFYVVLVLFIILFGSYGIGMADNTFIYFQF